MAKDSKIAWTKSTMNPWIGCTKVGPGCDSCYAEATDARRIFGNATHWGPGVPRLRTKPANWAQVRRWNREAPETEFAGVKGYWPVFTASLADIFDSEVPDDWRADYWALVRECQNLTFLIVTKRIGNAKRMLPADWGDGYPNVVLLATVVNQEEADRDIPKLLAVPARARGLSMEPLLGSVDLTAHLWGRATPCDECPRDADCACGFAQRREITDEAALHWIIVGGESGPKARPMHPDWARSLRDQAKAAGVPFHFKQHGEYSTHEVGADGELTPNMPMNLGGLLAWRADLGRFEAPAADAKVSSVFYPGAVLAMPVGKEAAGRELDGVEHDGIPGIARLNVKLSGRAPK